MDLRDISSQYNTIFSLDRILQDIPETTTEKLPDIEETYQSYKEELNFELKTTDREWLDNHAGQCEQFGKIGKSILYRIVNSSIGCPENSTAAANAITILKTMKISFSCLDLQGVQIPGADLSNAILDKADLSYANLENVNLTNAALNGTNISDANLKNVQFNIPDILIHEAKVSSSIVSPDNNYLISEDFEYMYFWQLSNKTCLKKIKITRSMDFLSDEKIFTPDGKFLFTYDNKLHIDIWSVGDFKHIQKLKISDEPVEELAFSFSQNGVHFIIIYVPEDIDGMNTRYVKLWEVQKIGESSLNINLKRETIIPYFTNTAYFSKKFPIFYCLQTTFDDSHSRKVSLVIRSIATFSEEAHINIGNILVNDTATALSFEEVESFNAHKIFFSLDICPTDKDNEELLYIAIGKTIYTLNISKKNEQKFTLDSFQITKAIKAIDETSLVYNLQISDITHELSYVSNDGICFYNIKKNALIGKFRLLDQKFIQVPIVLNEKLFVSYYNKIFVYDIATLKSNNNSALSIGSTTSCFSTNMSSIISISGSLQHQTYDLETGTVLKEHSLQKTGTQDSEQLINGFFHFKNSQYICMRMPKLSYGMHLRIINSETGELFFETAVKKGIFELSDTSEYLALLEPEERSLYVYKTTPFKQCIGKFYFEGSFMSTIAISKDFHNNPKIALIDSSNNIIINSFAFKDNYLQLISQKKLSIKESDSDVLQLKFIENNQKLIVASKNKIVLWSTIDNYYESYFIQTECLDISRNGSILIYYDVRNKNKDSLQLCLWSISQKKLLVTQTLSLSIDNLQISPDNTYILAATENGGTYVWKIVENAFRLLWRTTNNLQTNKLMLSNNNLEKDVEEELVTKMDAMKIADK